MSGEAYRDEEAALREVRAQLLVVRRAEEARAARIARVRAARGARLASACVALVTTSMLALCDLSGRAYGSALVLAAPLALVVLPLGRLWARVAPFVTSEDVRADIDRLRAAVAPGVVASRFSLARASFALPLAALALWLPLAILHLAIALVHAPLQYTEVMPGLVMRRMSQAESLGELRMGGAMLALASTIALCIAIARAVARDLCGKASTGETFARLFGGIFFGAGLGQLFAAWMGESATSVVVGYGALALGAVTGLFGWRALFALAGGVHAREERDDG